MTAPVPFSRRTEIYEATGGEAVLDVPFVVHDAADLTVTRLRGDDEVVLELGTDYTVEGLKTSDCEVLLTPAAVAGDIHLVEGNRLPMRATAYAGYGPFTADQVNTEFDNFARMMQEIRRDIDRSVRLSGFDERPGPVILQANGRGFLAIDDEGNVDTPVEGDIPGLISAATEAAETATTKAGQASASQAAAAGSQLAASNSANAAAASQADALLSRNMAAASAEAAADSEAAAAASEAAAAASEAIAVPAAAAAAASADAAASSEINAAGSEVAAQAIYLDFKNMWLSPKAADPALNDQGGSLVTGMMYYNHVDERVKIYNGAAWVLAFNDGVPASAIPNDSGVAGGSAAAALDTLASIKINKAAQATGGNLNAITAGGYYLVSNADAGGPSASFAFLEVIPYSSLYVLQRLTILDGSAEYQRRGYDVATVLTWTSWVQTKGADFNAWHTGNIASVSDAQTGTNNTKGMTPSRVLTQQLQFNDSIFLGTGSFSGGTTDVNLTPFLSIYASIIFDIQFMGTVNNNIDVGLRMSQDGGATFFAGGTDYRRNNATGSMILITTGIGTNGGMSGRIYLPQLTVNHWQHAYCLMGGNIQGPGGAAQIHGGMCNANSAPINAVRFVPASGNFSGGTYIIRGSRL